ncbi:MAG: InlB B-repeat-containing protein, partial [Clostridiales Family XIII bacterium]|nr:InlB B-repeat-containing protein [Clostridiales Family XIII bacterium]
LTQFSITHDTTLYAVWAASTYGVAYHANGGTGSVPSDATAYSSGGTVTVLFAPRPARAGHIFLGWDEDAGAAAPAYTESGLDHFNITSDTALYAVWEAIPQAATYGVSYDANGGTGSVPSDAASYGSGDTVTVLFTPRPARAGYAFLGWDENAGAAAPDYTESGLDHFDVTADTFLYAIWEAETQGGDIYTVTFNSNGGTVAPGDETRTVSASAVSASAVTLGAIMPPDPARAGYTLLGWNTRSDGSGTAFAASTPVTADIAVYALWAPAGGGGSGSTGGGTTTPPVTPDPPDEPPAPAEPPEATPPPEEPAQNLPSPSAPGHVLVPGSGGTYIEMGEDGIPLGEWHWDEPTQTWVFEEYPPPLANDALPQTGETRPGGFDLYGFLLLTFMLAVIGAGVLIRGRHRGIHRKQ